MILSSTMSKAAQFCHLLPKASEARAERVAKRLDEDYLELLLLKNLAVRKLYTNAVFHSRKKGKEL